MDNATHKKSSEHWSSYLFHQFWPNLRHKVESKRNNKRLIQHQLVDTSQDLQNNILNETIVRIASCSQYVTIFSNSHSIKQQQYYPKKNKKLIVFKNHRMILLVSSKGMTRRWGNAVPWRKSGLFIYCLISDRVFSRIYHLEERTSITFFTILYI